jgi:hypothetical protein
MEEEHQSSRSNADDYKELSSPAPHATLETEHHDTSRSSLQISFVPRSTARMGWLLAYWTLR